MRKASVWVLTIAGLFGLLLALGFEGHGGPREWEFRMGYPDAWVEVEWVSPPSSSVPGAIDSGFESRVLFLRWSFGILVASIGALSYAVRLGLRKGPAA